MAEEEKQDGQKTIVSFVVGLLIGGMLVWAFSGSPAETPSTTSDDTSSSEAVDTTSSDNSQKNTSSETVSDNSSNTSTPALSVGNGKISVNDQTASDVVTLNQATYPISEGWIGVRDIAADQSLSYILGVVRFSEADSIVPEQIYLQRPTTVGKKYAVVVFSDDGDGQFDPRYDIQVDQVYDTFTAQ